MKIDEYFLYHIWDEQHIEKENIVTNSGKKLEVLYPGLFDRDEGPDFKFARYLLDGELVTSDVEIEVEPGNWLKHGHTGDPGFSNVKLIVVWDDSKGNRYLFNSKTGEKLEILTLKNFADHKILSLFDIEDNGIKISNTFCPLYGSRKPIGELLEELGFMRMKNKLSRFSIRYGNLELFDELLYQGILESLGYHKNKSNFLNLAAAFPLRKIRQFISAYEIEEYPYILQAIYFYNTNLSDIFKPDEEMKAKISRYTRPVNDSGYFHPVEIPWDLFRTRPQNHPVRRLIYMSYWLPRALSSGLTEWFLSAYYNEGNLLNNLREAFQLNTEVDPCWERNWGWNVTESTRKLGFIGNDRIDIILFNIILPILYLLYQLERDQTQSEKIMEQLSGFPKLQDNFPQSLVSKRFMKQNNELDISRAIEQQGLLFLFENYCRKGICKQCVFEGE